MCVQNMLVNTMPSEFDNIFMTFSARTSANQTQDIIDSKMDKRRKGIFGPPAGKKFVIFVDDFNMPQREKYFAQPPLEVLRQWIDNGGWYERKPPCAWKTIIDSQVSAHRWELIAYQYIEPSKLRSERLHRTLVTWDFPVLLVPVSMKKSCLVVDAGAGCGEHGSARRWP